MTVSNQMILAQHDPEYDKYKKFELLLKQDHPKSKLEDWAVSKYFDYYPEDSGSYTSLKKNLGKTTNLVAYANTAASNALRVAQITALTPVTFPLSVLSTFINCGKSYSSYKSTGRHLEMLRGMMKEYAKDAKDSTLYAAAYTVVKKSDKQRRKKKGIFPFGGIIPAVYGVYRAQTKKHKGLARRIYAQQIMFNALEGDLCAWGVIWAISNKPVDKVLAAKDWKYIAEKMRST